MLCACWLGGHQGGGIAATTMPCFARRTFKDSHKGAIRFRALRSPSDGDLEAAAALSGHLGVRIASERRSQNAHVGAHTEFAACNTAQEDVAHAAFTSGTTGQPKATIHFHRDVIASGISWDAIFSHFHRRPVHRQPTLGSRSG